MKGLIFLAGFSDAGRETAIQEFKSRGAKIIRLHHKQSFVRDAFTCITASLKRAATLGQDSVVVVSASWLDKLIDIVGEAYLAADAAPQNTTKQLHNWLVLSRIIDRVALRYGAFYCVSPKAGELADVAFPGFSTRVTTVIAKGPSWIDDAWTQMSFTQCLHPNIQSINVNGNIAEADFLLVGDRINPRFAHFEHWPWYDCAASAFFITSQLHHLGISESRLAWTNAHHPTDAHVHREIVKHKRMDIVALGREAEKTLKAQGIVPKFSVPHPSWASRFGKQHDYREILSSVFGHNSK